MELAFLRALGESAMSAIPPLMQSLPVVGHAWDGNYEMLCSKYSNPLLLRCRKFKQGDILRVTVDTLAGWVEVSVNETDFMHRFPIPPAEAEHYVFAMTFANNHKVTIVQPSESLYANNVTALQVASASTEVDAATTQPMLSVEHSVMFFNLKRALTSLVDDKYVISQSTDKGFIAFCEGRYDVAGKASECGGVEAEFDRVWPFVKRLTSRDPQAPLSATESVKSPTWNELAAWVCWYRRNRCNINHSPLTFIHSSHIYSLTK
jgi:hypothetical protein